MRQYRAHTAVANVTISAPTYYDIMKDQSDNETAVKSYFSPPPPPPFLRVCFLTVVVLAICFSAFYLLYFYLLIHSTQSFSAFQVEQAV